MTWTHFTSYLDGSRPITKAERDELLDNFADLLSGDCAAAGYSLNATDLAAVKASGFLTDRACLDGPGALHLCDRLHELLEAASGAFSNYDDAVADALSDEGITEAERDTLLAAAVDAAHLWNYFKRLLDLLACGDCEAPILEVQKRDLSIARYGVRGFDDESTYFRTVVAHGWHFVSSVSLELFQRTCSYGALGLSVSGSGDRKVYTSTCLSPADLPPPGACLDSTTTGCTAPLFAAMLLGGEIISNTRLRGSPAIAFYGEEILPRGDEHLLNEITEAAFLAEVDAALRAQSWVARVSGVYAGAFAESWRLRSGQTTTQYLRGSRFRAKFPVPAGGGYRITWKLWFQPRTWDGAAWVEGAPVFVADQAYEWDGVTPGGYDAGDNATWPISPWLELPDPTADGGFFLTNLAWECSAAPTPTAPDGLQVIAA